MTGLTHHATGLNRLLRPVQSGADWRDTAIIGGPLEDDGVLADGFIHAADILVKHWKRSRPNDALVLPILANYRHSIELALKDGIRGAATCVRRDGHNDPELCPDVMNNQLSRTHSIGRLVEILNSLLGLLDLGADNQLPADTREVLDSLHLLDDSGQSLRYSTVKTGKGKSKKLERARADQQNFDLVRVASTLHEAATLLLHGVTGVLGQYEEWQAEMRQEYGDYYS